MPRMATAGDQTVRRTAQEIFKRVEDNAHSEVRRSTQALAFSGLAGGLTMGLTGLGVATALAVLPDSPSRDFVAYLLYPLGFIAVIIGRAQLFTENTLYPVALILSERRHVLDTARLWAVVFTSNVMGAIAFSALAIRTDALNREISHNWCNRERISWEAASAMFSGVRSSVAGLSLWWPGWSRPVIGPSARSRSSGC